MSINLENENHIVMDKIIICKEYDGSPVESYKSTGKSILIRPDKDKCGLLEIFSLREDLAIDPRTFDHNIYFNPNLTVQWKCHSGTAIGFDGGLEDAIIIALDTIRKNTTPKRWKEYTDRSFHLFLKCGTKYRGEWHPLLKIWIGDGDGNR